MRFALLGLYNSGTSTLAGMLHRLGANLGPPFWQQRPGHDSKVYEADDLARELRRWWDEPQLVERVSAPERVAWLRDWIARQESRTAAATGAKHPLLSLCGPELATAWGAETRFIWARRPLEDSIAGLARRGWWPGREAAIQQRLWEALALFADSGNRLLTFDWGQVRDDPFETAAALADWLDLRPDAGQLAAAAAFVRTS